MNLTIALFDFSSAFLGYVPFRDPLPTERFWLAWSVLLVIGLSVVYKTLNLEDTSKMPKEAAIFAFKVLGFMVCAVIVLWSLTELL